MEYVFTVKAIVPDDEPLTRDEVRKKLVKCLNLINNYDTRRIKKGLS